MCASLFKALQLPDQLAILCIIRQQTLSHHALKHELMLTAACSYVAPPQHRSRSHLAQLLRSRAALLPSFSRPAQCSDQRLYCAQREMEAAQAALTAAEAELAALQADLQRNKTRSQGRAKYVSELTRCVLVITCLARRMRAGADTAFWRSYFEASCLPACNTSASRRATAAGHALMRVMLALLALASDQAFFESLVCCSVPQMVHASVSFHVMDLVVMGKELQCPQRSRHTIWHTACSWLQLRTLDSGAS